MENLYDNLNKTEKEFLNNIGYEDKELLAKTIGGIIESDRIQFEHYLMSEILDILSCEYWENILSVDDKDKPFNQKWVLDNFGSLINSIIDRIIDEVENSLIYFVDFFQENIAVEKEIE